MSQPLQFLDPSGELVGDAPFDLDETRRLYRALVASRLYDHKASALQRQGRLATYSPFEGQEAAQIGSAAALRPDDWMVATYRDAAAMWFQGYPWVNLFLGRTGDERGGESPAGVNVLPPSITVGAHMIHAVGLAWGERLAGSDRIAVTYFGDGATSEGDFHEAMNFAGVYATGTVFVCQNNGFAISMSRDRQTAAESIAAKGEGYGVPSLQVDGNDLFAMFQATSAAVERARSGGGPTLIEALTYRIGPHTTTDDPTRYRDEAEVEQWRRRDPLERVRLYLKGAGAWDASWQAEIEAEEGALIEEAAAAAEAMPARSPAEMFGAMYATETVELVEQLAMLERVRRMTEMNLAQSINAALAEALEGDDRVVVLGEDVGATGGVFRVTDGLAAKYGADRVIDTPVAESGIAGAAFGMAVAGLRPVAEIQFMGFSYPAFDQIISHVSRIRNRSNHRFSAPLVIRIPYGGGIGAAEHHSESAEAIYAHTPGVKVVVPSRPRDAKGLLAAAIADPDPVIFMEPIRLYRAIKEDVPEDRYEIPIGVAAVEQAGTDITFVSWGAMMRETRAAADELEGEGVSVEVIDMRSMVPFDTEAVIESGSKTGRAVIVQEAHRTAGFASEIAAQIGERALYSLAAPVERVTGWDTIVPLRKAEGHYIPSVGRVLAAARRALEA